MSLGQCNPQHKLLWHVDKLADIARTGTTSPLLFEIDPSNKCNQDCPWCAFNKLRSKSNDMMDYGTVYALLHQLKRMGVKAINWTGGGEPLMHPKFAEMVLEAKSLGLDQGIFTNGLLLKQSLSQILADNMTWIRISLDGYDEESYAISHGTSNMCFSRVVANTARLLIIPKRCSVGIGFVMNEKNWMGTAKAVKLARDLGADYIQLKPVAYRPDKKQVSARDVEYWYNYAKRLESRYKTKYFNVMVTHYRFKDMIDEPNRGRYYKKCLSHHIQGAAGADSKVYLCDHHKGEPAYELGDLKLNTLEWIWKSQRRKDVIEMLDKTDLSQCQDCCRNHEANKFLWNMLNKDDAMHPNHI